MVMESFVHQQIHKCSHTMFYRLLQCCIWQRDPVAGRQIHCKMVEVGLGSDPFLVNHLIRMYAICGELNEASQVFETLPAPDVFAWTAVITMCVKNGQAEVAVRLYDRMQRSHVTADEYVYVAILKACGSIGAGGRGKLVHGQVMEAGYQSNVFVCNALIDMYCKCGILEDARSVFDKMVARDAVSWNTMIGGYSQQGLWQEALELFQEMRAKGVNPDQFTFVSILKLCCMSGNVAEGRKIHAYAAEYGFHDDVFVSSILIDLYSKCGSLGDAQDIFDRLPAKDLVSWNVLIAGYAHQGLGQEAIVHYEGMHHDGINPDRITYINVLKACSCVAALELGKLIYCDSIRSGFEVDGHVQSSAIDMFAKCGSLEEARSVFDKISMKHLVSWTAMITGYSQEGDLHNAIQLYQQMQEESLQPNEFTLVSMVKACSTLEALEHGQLIHNHIVKGGFDSDHIVRCTLIEMYSKCDILDDARKLFNGYEECDQLSWNAMVAGYVHNGSSTEALQLFQQMQEVGMPPDTGTYNSVVRACSAIAAFDYGRLIHAQLVQSGFDTDYYIGCNLLDMYVKCGNLGDARRVFDKLPRKDTSSWNVIIAGYSQHGDPTEALALYHRMQLEGVRANKVTFLSILKACSSTADVTQGNLIHADIMKCGLGSDLHLASLLIDMYSRCGSLDDARKLFDRLPHKHLVSWTAMIAGYVQKGELRDAFHLFEQMQMEGLRPDKVILASILKACSNLVALHQGKQIHAQAVQAGMESDLVVGSALIDMYAKCGSIEDAETVFHRFWTRDLVTWNAMIAGYAQHGHFYKALQLLAQMQSEGIRPDSITFLCLLASCSNAGLLDEGRVLFQSMSETFDITPDKDHYACMVNLLGRAGHLDEAEDFIRRMPSRPGIEVWMSILGSCNRHGNTDLGRRAFNAILELDPTTAGAYIIMSNTYAAAGRFEERSEIRKLMFRSGVHKEPGRTWMELDNQMHAFLAEDSLHSDRKMIYETLESVLEMLSTIS